jgi:site-specific DNA recombinase
MTKAEENLARDSILQYSQEYLLKKGKSKKERALLEGEEPRYVIYARKSTEDEKRQVQSISDQLDLCKQFAKDNNLNVVDIRWEEKSAMYAGKRDVFTDILENISKGGIYDSILAWHPDRLSRNMKESGEILDLLDNEKIKDLKFVSYTFTNDAAGKMSLSILFAMAKEFSDKLSVDTKRGIRRKIQDGKYCGSYKRGYTTNNSEYFIPDDEKYDIYKDVWKLALEGESYGSISAKYPEEKIAKGYLKDPFAAGIYCYGDQIVEIKEVYNKFKPLISYEDFITVQKLLQTKGGWTLTDDFLPFRDFVRCKHCGNLMTPGRSRSKSKDRYLYIVCENSKCKEEIERKYGYKSNRIRSGVILDKLVEVLKSHQEVSEGVYNKVISKYKAKAVKELNDIEENINVQNREIAKLEQKEKVYSDKLISDDNYEEVHESISKILDQRKERKDKLKLLKLSLVEMKTKYTLEIPSYEIFLNFFKKLVPAIQKTDNPQLIDNIVKMVFLNTTIYEKKVYGYELKEPFKTYWSIKKSSGVDGGSRFELNLISSF